MQEAPASTEITKRRATSLLSYLPNSAKTTYSLQQARSPTSNSEIWSSCRRRASCSTGDVEVVEPFTVSSSNLMQPPRLRLVARMEVLSTNYVFWLRTDLAVS